MLELQPFFGTQIGDWFVARTGYTGEDGFEIMLPAAEAVSVWQRLNAAGVHSCGLGARDTLRLEAGMNLYGNDMDEHTSPLESGLAWTVAFDPPEREFVGRAALEAVRRTRPRRASSWAWCSRSAPCCAVISACWCPGWARARSPAAPSRPTLERSIGLARVPIATGGAVQVEIRGRSLPARVVRCRSCAMARR